MALLQAFQLLTIVISFQCWTLSECSFGARYERGTHNSNDPYITSYRNHETKQSNYDAAYETHTHDSNEPYKKNGYISARDSEAEVLDQKHVDLNDESYMTQYGNKKPNQKHVDLNDESYMIQYGNKKPNQKHVDSNDESYMTQYRDKKPNQKHVDSNDESYMTQYGNKKSNQKHVDSNDESYMTQYRDKKPKYPASYTIVKHNNHVSLPKMLSEPYISGYKTSVAAHEAKQSNYPAAYKTNIHDSNEPYKTSYSNPEVNKRNYAAAYKTDTHDSNEPYITIYGNHEVETPNYAAAYKTHTHDSNEPYITSYGNQETKLPNYAAAYKTHESSEPYTTSYGNHETKLPNFVATYKTHDSNEPYITSYGNHETKLPNYAAAYKTHDSNEPYITSYGNSEVKKPKYAAVYKTYTHDSNEPYLAGYISTALNPKGPPSTNSEDLKGSQSLNLDRIEAFKTGFFNLDDLHVGNVMTLQFPVQEVSHFLSRKEADSIPLSISQLQSVLQLLSIPEDSPQAKSMRGTLEQCEGETITGETKICASSLESVLEFVDKIIGSNTKHNILTTNYPSHTAAPLQKYTILKVSHDINAPKWVACHPLPYPYAIYYCHYIATGTKVFKVSLVGDENGDQMEALGVCHLDTSDWNPDHVIFKQLGIKAGKNSPVCHFFPVNHLLWVPMQPSKATM